jgi:hypothetical protein
MEPSMRLRNVAISPRFVLLSMYCPVLYYTVLKCFYFFVFLFPHPMNGFLLIMHMTEKTLRAFVSWVHGVCRT